MTEPNAAQPAATAPDPADFSAYAKARESGWSPSEPGTPVAEAGGEKPTQPPAESAETPPEKPSSESAATEAAKAETPPGEPEPGKTEEPKQGEKPEQKAETPEEHGPGWYRRELKRLRRETREEMEALRAQLAEGKRAEPAAASPVKEPPPKPAAEPKEDDFESHGDYLRALAKYHGEQIAAKKIADFQESVKQQLDAEDRDARQRQAAAIQAQLDNEWAEKVNQARERYEDFDEVVFSSNVQVSPLMDRFVHESETGADVAYHLSSKPQEAQRIAALPPLQAVRELVKIEAQFSPKPSSAPEPQPKVNGPPKPKPTTPIGGGNSMSAIEDPNHPEVARDFKRWARLKEEQQRR